MKKHKDDQELMLAFYMCIGLSVGVGIGSAFGNVSLGMCCGLALGVLVGGIIDAQNRKIKGNDDNSDEEA